MENIEAAYRDVFGWWRQALAREAELKAENERLRLLIAVLRVDGKPMALVYREPEATPPAAGQRPGPAGPREAPTPGSRTGSAAHPPA